MGALLSVSFAAGVRADVGKDTDPKPTPVDIKPLRDKLLVFQDKAGGTYVVFTAIDGVGDATVFYGTGKTLYKQISVGRSRNGDAWSVSTWAPRLEEVRPASVMRKDDGTYMKWCDGKDDAVLTELTGDKAKAVLDKYTFLSPALVRRPHLFARDDAGVYYYIDRLDKDHGGKGYRVFVGKKGAMKQLSLLDVASDSAGQVFSTKTGDLRLVRTTGASEETKPSTKWVKGEKKTELITLDVDANSPVIFTDLGIYSYLGTLCDNL